MGTTGADAPSSTRKRFGRRLLAVLLVMSIPLGQAAIARASGGQSASGSGAQSAPTVHGGARLGEQVRVSGRYRVFHRDDFADPSRDVFRNELVTPGGRVLSLHGSGFSHVEPGSTISVDGRLAGNDLFVGADTGTQITVTGKAGSQASVGRMNTAVILADFSNSTTSLNVAPLRALYQGNPGGDVVSYFTEASYGKLQVAPSFFGPYRMAEASQTGCRSFDPVELLQRANADIDYTNFSRLVFVANCTGYGASASSAGSMATPDGTITAAEIIEDATSSTTLYTQVHELSHTLGSFNAHAAVDICLPDVFTPPARFDQGCDVAEYGDPFDVLGGGKFHRVSQLDPYHKSVAGWLSPSQFPSVTASGTYTLAPYENPGSGIVALNVPRGVTGTAFTVEYRQAAGFDSWMGSDCGACTVAQGASIRLAGFDVIGSGGGSDTQLLDDTPGTIVDPTTYYPVDDVLDGALLPGHTFTDPETGITIEALSAGPSGLSVRVSVPAQACVRGVPAVTAPGPSSQTASAGQARIYTFTLTNRDSTGCPSNTFRFFRASTYSDLTVTATPDYVVLPPGDSTSVSVTITSKPSTVDGTYDYSAGLGRFFSNSLGNYMASVPGVTYRVTSPADTTRPGAPTGLTASALGSATVGVSWAQAADNLGVAGYLIQRDDSVFTSPTTWFLDTNLSPGTTYTYSITAYDRRNNQSAPASVSVTTPERTDYTAPTAAAVRATATDRSISLHWSGARDAVGVAYYRVVPCLSTCWLPASMTSLTATGLPTRTRYDVQVIPVDGDGNFAIPLPYPVTTGALGDSPPSRPDLLFSPSGTAARTDLSWPASTDDGGVTGYDVYRNNRRIARVASTSYSDPIGGSHEYYVQAVDGDGSLSSPSPRVWFLGPTSSSSDGSPPSASVAAPSNGSTASGTTTVTASASDDVAVTKVELYVDGVLAGTTSSEPFSFQWDTTNLPNGSHSLYVRAYDAARNYGTTGVVSVAVDNGGGGVADTTPPTVSITAPSDASTISAPVDVTADASDDVAMDRVEFSVDGTIQATATGAPYGFRWDAVGAGVGPHTISATAYDVAGNSAASSVTVSVGEGDTAPSPPTDLATAIGHSVDLTWSPPTDGTTVAEYSIVRDGTEIAQATGTEYADEEVVHGETYRYQVVTVDTAGNRSAPSNTSTITVPLLDTVAPSAPQRLAVIPLGGSRVAMSWSPGKDDHRVAGYDVYRNGVKVASVRNRTYVDLHASGRVAYRVKTRDSSGNVSVGSPLERTTAPKLSGPRRIAALVVSGGSPLANVRVRTRIRGSRRLFSTNSIGTFQVTYIPAGTYRLTFLRMGYTSVVVTLRVAATGTSARRVVLSPR
jgi:fibronectin type 3 domain-containing protein